MNEKVTSYFDRHQFQLMLILLVSVTLGMTLLIIYNNSFRVAPIFIFMLVLGMGSTLLWGWLRGGAVALVVITLWIYTKQSVGIWNEMHTYPDLIELAGLLILFSISAWFGTRLNTLLEKFDEISQKLDKFNIEDRRIGLIKAFVGELRLREEEERSQRYRRPFVLVLIHCLPLEDVKWDSGEMIALMRTIANTVKSTSRRIDIPFLVDPATIALLLPETDIQGANKVLYNLMTRMRETQFLHPQMGMLTLDVRTQIRYGVAAYSLNGSTPSNILEAAKQSLKKNLEKNINTEFQNIVVDWEEPKVTQSVVATTFGSDENS